MRLNCMHTDVHYYVGNVRDGNIKYIAVCMMHMQSPD